MFAHLLAIAFVPLLLPQDPTAPAGPLTRRTWSVDGAERTALLHVPPTATTEPTPLVFVFHGHGGTAAAVARSFHLHELWPDAVVVYPQGLPTPTGRDPEGQRAGWQNRPGTHGDRDLQFVDTMLASLQQELRIDRNHIHATGHSNGGGFTYLLWAERSDLFASYAPSAAGAGGLRDKAPTPRPVLHIAGRRDTVVPFAQQQRTIQALLAAQQAAAGEPWPAAPRITWHRAANGGHVALLVHDGTHAFPAEAPACITAFFQATARPDPWVTGPARGTGLVHHVYRSPAAGTEVSYHVYLPPDYGDEPERRYPVVYWLHGSGGGLAGIPTLARAFDDAIRRELLPPCLVVFPNGLPNGMWCDAIGGPPVETVVLGEVLPRIDRLFRTIAGREGRIVEGFSMGGYGAARFGFLHPERFAGVSILGGGPLQRELTSAPRVDEGRRLQVLRSVYGDDLAVFRQRSPWQLAIDHQQLLRTGPRIRQVIGQLDETLPANRALHAHLQDLGIPHDYVELAEVPHDPQRVLEVLGDGFWQFHRQVFSGPRPRD